MQISCLTIERRPSYDSEFPNQLVGTVEFTSLTGVQTVRLSNGALSRVFGVIAAEVQQTARDNAAQVRRGVEDAMNEPLMLEATKVQLED